MEKVLIECCLELYAGGLVIGIKTWAEPVILCHIGVSIRR